MTLKLEFNYSINMQNLTSCNRILVKLKFGWGGIVCDDIKKKYNFVGR